MSVVTLLPWLATGLTLIGAYRFATFFYRDDPLYALCTAVVLTSTFLILFDFIVLATGLAVVLLPGWLLLRRSDDHDARDPGEQAGLPADQSRERIRHAFRRITARSRELVNTVRGWIANRDRTQPHTDGGAQIQSETCVNCGVDLPANAIRCGCCGARQPSHPQA